MTLVKKYVLLSHDKKMCNAWRKDFCGIVDVKVENARLADFMNTTDLDIDGIVSPANSFGIMDGGYDAAIIEYFGTSLMEKVQDNIKKRYKGIQPVGTALSVLISDKVTLLHVPTMLFPRKIADARIIFQCMLSTLIEAERNDLKTIVIPAFGSGYGKIDYYDVSRMMRVAYDYYMHPIDTVNWDTVGDFVDATYVR